MASNPSDAPLNQIKGFVVILGSPNDALGHLTEMGHRRLAKGYAEYIQRRAANWKILLTGGFGEHFNTTDKPHAYYAQQILLAQGVPPTDIVEFAESRHTVEDATLTRRIVEPYGVKNLVVVSSDFHLPRVKFIFRNVCPNMDLSFVEAEYLSLCSREEQQRLLDHEARALERLRMAYPSWS